MGFYHDVGLVRVVFSTSVDVPLIGWSGSFVAKIVYDVFKSRGIVFKREMPKPFSISPLCVVKRGGEEIVWSGVCEKGVCRKSVVYSGRRYSFTIAFMDTSLVPKFIEGLQEYNSYGFKPIEISYNCEKIGLRIKNPSTERIKAVIEIDYTTPTHYIHRSWEILYPSDKRLLYSLAKTLYNLTKINLKAYIERVMAKGIELLDQKTRIITVKIGEKKLVPAFIGKAKYGIYLKKYEYKILKELLKIGETIGVGRNRALGFGKIKTKTLEEQ